MNVGGLTLEQKQRIEENKKKALLKLADKRSPVKQPSQPQSAHSSTNVTYTQQGARSSLSNNENTRTQTSTSKSFKPAQSVQAVLKPGVWTSKAAGQAEKNVPVSKVYFDLRKDPSKGKCVLISDTHFSVEIGYHTVLIEYFKQFRTKNYDQANKTWSFKLEEYDAFIKGLANFKPDIEIEPLPPWILNCFGPQRNQGVGVAEADLKRVDEKLVETLMPFQRDGVNFAIKQNGRLLIADDMGLGKTLQAICIAGYYRNEWPLLIVSPSSVRFDWSQQIQKWLPSVTDVNVVETGKDSAVSGLVNIISYDLLHKKRLELTNQRFRIIIMDESHFLKNAKAVRTLAALPLLKKAERVILLSGTPALSRPSELFSQIIAICPGLFQFHDYATRYCNAKQVPWGWDYTGSSNMQELQLFLEKKIMIRRMKKDVLSQLPSKTRNLVYLDPHTIKSCKNLNNVSKAMSSSYLKGLERREVLLQYFHETCKVKLQSVRQYMLDLIESDKKFLVFAHHSEMLDNIEECITSKNLKVKYIRIDGRTPSEQRNYLCGKFQSNSSYRIAILSITAANAGLNLCAANLVVFAELFWNPGVLVQAEDRVHRIGQEDSVVVQYLVAKGTADDYIWPLIQDKLNILSKVGLTKENFSHADTSFATDRSQMKILNMFKSDFIDELPVQLSINECLESSQQATPPKRSNKGEDQPSSQKLLTSSQGTPTKRQTCLTSFFELSPPKKVQRLEPIADEDTLDPWEDLNSDKPRGADNSNTNPEIKLSQYKNDDIFALEKFDWDDEFQ